MGQKVYRVRQITWIIPIVFVAPIAFLLGDGILLTIQTVTTHDTSAIAPLLSLFILTFFFAYVTLLFFDIPNTGLALSDEGVLFYGVGYRLYTPWHNISSVTWTRRSPRFPSFFELKEPAVTTLSLDEGKANQRAIFETHWWVPARLFQPKQISAHIPVPVRLLPKKERGDGILTDYFQQYAPHLRTSA